MADVRADWALGEGGRPPLAADERIVRFYRSTTAYERDLARLAEAGWRVIKVVTPPRWTWRQLLAFGLPAGTQRQPELLVTYARSQAAAQRFSQSVSQAVSRGRFQCVSQRIAPGASARGTPRVGAPDGRLR